MYEDVVDNEKNLSDATNITKTSNPDTSDNIKFWIILTVISVIGIAGIIIIVKKRIKKGR